MGHVVTVIDPWRWLGTSKWAGRWAYHFGGLGLDTLLHQQISQETKETSPDLIWVDQGEFLGEKSIAGLRRVGAPIVNYAVDDPFGPRDWKRFVQYRKAVPYYDLLAVVREQNVQEAYRAKARKVVRVWRSADELAHAPRSLTPDEKRKFTSDVVFVGTWMPERGPFMVELIDRGVPLSIWGNHWEKSKEWNILKQYWRGPALNDDRSYSAAVLAAKVCLGLLSKGNRDLHTQRSLEIPALGSLLCAERTSEHIALYHEGAEAIFWNSAEECASVCNDLLVNEQRRRNLAKAGYERAIHNNLFNEPVLASIISMATAATYASGTDHARKKPLSPA